MKKNIMLLGLITLSVAASGCGRNNGETVNGTADVTVLESVTQQESESISESTSENGTESQSESESAIGDTDTTDEAIELVADGSYDADEMDKLIGAYEKMALELSEYEKRGSVTDVRSIEAEQKEGKDIVVCSAGDIAIYRDYSEASSDECVLEWGEQSFTLPGMKEWSGFPAQHMKFTELDTDGDGDDELIVSSEVGARGYNVFCFIDIVDGEAVCDYYSCAELEEYHAYDDFIVTYKINDMDTIIVKNIKDELDEDEIDSYINGDERWWNDDGKLMDNPYINVLAGPTYEIDFFEASDGGCIVRIGQDLCLGSLAGWNLELYSYYRFSDGKLELLGRR